MFDKLDFHSSSISWCEPKYVYTGVIVEFWNTITSLFITLAGLYGLWSYNNKYQTQKYQTQYQTPCQHNHTINTLYSLLCIIGLGSVWFHGTLSFAGQMMDEISIVWLVIIFLLSDPEDYFQQYFSLNTIVLLFVTSSYFVLYLSHINAWNMIILGCILAGRTIFRLLALAKIAQLIKQSFALLIIGVVFWSLDHLCESDIHLHWLWHVCIGIAGMQMVHVWAIRLHTAGAIDPSVEVSWKTICGIIYDYEIIKP